MNKNTSKFFKRMDQIKKLLLKWILAKIKTIVEIFKKKKKKKKFR